MFHAMCCVFVTELEESSHSRNLWSKCGVHLPSTKHSVNRCLVVFVLLLCPDPSTLNPRSPKP